MNKIGGLQSWSMIRKSWILQTVELDDAKTAVTNKYIYTVTTVKPLMGLIYCRWYNFVACDMLIWQA